MLKSITRRISPQIAILIILSAVVGGSIATLLLTRSEPKADALVVPRAARVERVDGNVGAALLN